MIAEVIVDIQNKQVNRTFDYIIPDYLVDVVHVGYRVRIPFGATKRAGFVVGIKDDTDYDKTKMKSIIDCMDVYPVLSEEFIELGKHIAENNFSFYATALQTMIPSALKIKYQKVAKIVNKDNLPPEALEIFKRDEILLDSLDNDKQRIVFKCVKNGDVILDTKIKKKKDTNQVVYVELINDEIKPTSKQGAMLVEYLSEVGEPIELNSLVEDSGFSKGVIETLKKNGIVKTFTKEIIPDIEYNVKQIDKVVTLNDFQNKVYNRVDMNIYKTYLLHGVTGSGKTEVYMRWILDILNKGKTAIMLVPEISLTPQITNLFLSRFKSDVAILHSRLTPTEKYNEWKKIYNNDVKIVIGARSAIFAPLKNLGIIIIDECHEQSYVQNNNPKYSAIDIAKIRCEHHNCPCVLGSATPNITDYYYATNGEYELLSLPTRANGRLLPPAEVVDLRHELETGNKSVFSRKLSEEMIKCYKNGEQSILFLNRRGFSSFVMCRSCGETVKCPHCDISLTYHASTQMLKCHYCGYQTPNVHRCHNCGSDKIRFVGSGTERIMEEAKRIIPEARIIRLDLDTVNLVSDYENAFFKFKNHEADILVGTQMITKGLDFENVTLVGVLNADLALHYPTYDAPMVAFNLIEQVSGRAGRAQKDGKVIIQTYNPTSYVIECAKNHDYDTFYKYEINNRKLTQMPPFSEAIEIRVSSRDANKAHNEAKHVVEDLKNNSIDSKILGPAEAMPFKKNDVFSFTIQILAVDDDVLERIKYIYPIYQSNKDVSISITRM